MAIGKKLVMRTSIISALVFGLLLVMADSCMQFRMSKKEVSHFFEGKRWPGSWKSYHVGRQPITYVVAGDSTKPLVLFVHGSPGSLSAFIDFMDDSVLLTHVQLATVDRPGFGASNFGYAEPSLQRQAAALKPLLLAHKNGRPVYLLGHSLGGPVIARMAMDYPELIDGLIFVAASVDPELEPNEWFRAPLATPFLKWMLPRSLRASNDEIYQLKPELEHMLPLWKSIHVPTIIIQGGKDSLVPPANAEFIQRMLPNASVKMVREESMDHFVPWSHPHLIQQGILEMTNGWRAASAGN